MQVAADALFMAAWYWLLLVSAHRRERYLQTATALFGLQTVLAAPSMAMIWLMQRIDQQASLRLMRETLLDETRPSAMVVIGGMPGVAEEVSLYQERFPGQPIYAIGTPGGIASSLIDAAPADMAQLLTTDRVYPFVTRRIIEHLANHL